MDDPVDKYRKEQDLIFQEMEERALFQKQAIAQESVEELQRKMKASGVTISVISEMMNAGKTLAQIFDFLDGRMIDNLAKNIMAAGRASGKLISEEEARQKSANLLELNYKKNLT